MEKFLIFSSIDANFQSIIIVNIRFNEFIKIHIIAKNSKYTKGYTNLKEQEKLKFAFDRCFLKIGREYWLGELIRNSIFVLS